MLPSITVHGGRNVFMGQGVAGAMGGTMASAVGDLIYAALFFLLFLVRQASVQFVPVSNLFPR